MRKRRVMIIFAASATFSKTRWRLKKDSPYEAGRKPERLKGRGGGGSGEENVERETTTNNGEIF
jgi:hypothetical protein